jgi:hypothetical protein
MFIPGQVRNQHGLHERFVSPALQLTVIKSLENKQCQNYIIQCQPASFLCRIKYSLKVL